MTQYNTCLLSTKRGSGSVFPNSSIHHSKFHSTFGRRRIIVISDATSKSLMYKSVYQFKKITLPPIFSIGSICINADHLYLICSNLYNS